MSDGNTIVDWLLTEAADLVAASTPETRTHRIDVLAEWLATLLSARHPQAVPRRIALTDIQTGAACEEVCGDALLEIEIESDGIVHRGTISLYRAPSESLRPV